MKDLENCNLCEWRCGVDRLAGEVGACRVGRPEVASRMLHPAPPESYTIFMAGCNFRCLHCQNWDIAHFPDTGAPIDGSVDPRDLALEGVAALESAYGQMMGADRLFFSGGESTCSLPFVEEVVYEARKLNPAVKVNFDTNGFATEASFERILELATSVTFDIRAADDQVHRAMTGAPSRPVLRNARKMAAHPGKLWEFRVLVVPGINQGEIESICRFIAAAGEDLQVAFLAFRPNFVLEHHDGASTAAMDRAVEIARSCGLKNAQWHGSPGIPGRQTAARIRAHKARGAQTAEAFSKALGCPTSPRSCKDCDLCHDCPVKQYRSSRRT